jgi:hypothetical protein
MSFPSMARQLAPLRAWGEVAHWVNERFTSDWWTLADAAANTSVSLETLQQICNTWEAEQWLETRTDSGRLMWRATERFPAVEYDPSHNHTHLWSRLLSAAISIPWR